MKLVGSKPKEIRDTLDISREALRSTLSLDYLRDEGHPQLRSGRPKEYIEAEERKLIRYVRLYPKDTYIQVRIACDLSIKCTIIKKILKKYRIIN